MAWGFMIVDGEGDRAAAPSLVNRLWAHLALPRMVWSRAIKLDANKPDRLRRAAELARGYAPDALLVLTDADDICPKAAAPVVAETLSRQHLPFPTAVVFLRREFETLFLPCMRQLAGQPLTDDRGISRPGLLDSSAFIGTDYEAVRGVKEWLSQRMPAGRSYKETLDQVALTRLLDFNVLDESGLPCFGSLCRALRFLAGATAVRVPGRVYPPAAPSGAQPPGGFPRSG